MYNVFICNILYIYIYFFSLICEVLIDIIFIVQMHGISLAPVLKD